MKLVGIRCVGDEEFWVNPEQVVYISRLFKNEKSWLKLIDGATLEVLYSVEELRERLAPGN